MATIRKRNNHWQVMIRRKDAPYVSKTFKRKTEAESWAREIEIDADRGLLKHDPRILNRVTLGDLLKRYLDTVSCNKAGKHIETYVINAVLREPISMRSLASLGPPDFANYRDLRLTQVSGSTVNRQLAIINHAYEIAAKEWGLPLQFNPLAFIRKPKNNPARNRRLRAGEYEALVRSADESRNKLMKPIIILAIETAMRRGELLNIERSHLNIKQRHLYIPETKTGKPRTIPISETSIRLLSERYEKASASENKLFPMTANALRLAWEHIKSRAGIEDLHFHDLRHEAISRKFEEGFGVAHVAAISGHHDFRMLARYTHLSPTISTTNLI